MNKDTFQLFTDKSTVFECRVELEGATLRDTTARLVVETAERTFLFKGYVASDGTCRVSVGKMRNLLDENATGTVSLEVIVEDTYFQPWSSDFVVAPSKKMVVEQVQAEQAQPSRPTMKVAFSTPASRLAPKLNNATFRVVNSVVSTLRENNISVKNVTKNKQFLTETIDSAVLDLDANELFEVNFDAVIPQVIRKLSTR